MPPKPVVNNKITYQNIYGLVSKHDGYLSQGVKAGDSPTFANLLLTGDGTIRGNLYVEGSTTILNTNVIEFEDNIVLLNRLENGAGVTLNQSGLEIERGTLENYRVVYNELDSTFKVGVISNLQAVATREDVPLQDGIMMWNNTTRRLDSRNTISIDLVATSTTNSTSTSTGSFVLSGGIGIAKDVWTNGKIYLRGTSHTANSVIWTNTTTNSLNLSSVSDINITPATKINIGYDKPIILGQDTQSIVAEAVTKNIVFTGAGNINFNLDAGKRINIPNQIPITFSTQSEQIYTDSSNNMVIGSSQDINLTPGANKKVAIPLNIGLIFSNANQQISANLNNDLMINAGNNIMLTPGPTLDVRLPTDNGIKFGSSGLQRIYADSSDVLYIKSASEINLDATNSVKVPDNVKVYMGDLYFKSSSGNLYLDKSVGVGNFIIDDINLSIHSTVDANNATSGSIWTNGGLGVTKMIYTNGGLTVKDGEIVMRGSGLVDDILNISSSSNGNISIVCGNGNDISSMRISSTSVIDSKSLIVLGAQYDNSNGYMIGRGWNTYNSGRSITINIPDYAEYFSSGDRPKFSVTTENCTRELFSIETETGNVVSNSTVGATNVSTASFVIYGGLGVVKNIMTQGDIYSKTESTTALDMKNNIDSSVLLVDTVNSKVNILGRVSINSSIGNYIDIGDGKYIMDSETDIIHNTMTCRFTNTQDTSDVSSGAVVISGGVGIQRSLRVSGPTYIYDDLDMNNKIIKNVKNPVNSQDVATKAYVDFANLRGLYIKQSIDVATVTSGNLNTDFVTGVNIDNYTLRENDRILIKDQLNPVENGIYIVKNTGAPDRSLDLIVGDNAAGVFVFIKRGNLNGSLGWICNSPVDHDIIGSDDIIFVQFTALGQVDAGDGLTKTFNRLDVNVDNTSLEIDSDQIRIKNTALGTGMTGGSGSPLQTSSDQSHVTKLGTINTGTWNASSINVFYGGTGNSRFTKGNILFGDGINPIRTDNRFYYDNDNCRLGIGTNTPSKNLHLTSSDNVSILLNADSDGFSSASKPEIIFSYVGDVKSYIGLSRNANEYASNVYSGSLVISQDKTDTTSVIQLATNRQSRLTILSNGNVGINTSSPSSRLYVTGTFTTTGINTLLSTTDSTTTSNGAIVISGGLSVQKTSNFGGKLYVYDNTPSTSINTGAVIVSGGLSIAGNQNAVNVGNGGALTVLGGGSIGGDLYVGGSINGSGSSSSTFAYLTLTSTDEAINLSTGSLITFGGITIQATTNASSLTDGGSILTEGGASIGADIYIGGNNNLYGYSNYYTGGNVLRFLDDNLNMTFSISRDITTKNFSLDRYNNSGIFIERTFDVNHSNGSFVFGNNLQSTSETSASVVLTGGLSIACDIQSTSLTSGGGMTIAGGISVVKNAMIGGKVTLFSTQTSTNMTSASFVLYGGASIAKDVNIYGNTVVDGKLTTNNTFNYNGGGQFDTFGSSSIWYYFGKINDLTDPSYCEIDLVIGGKGGSKTKVNINDTVCSASYNYYGSFEQTAVNLYVYRDTSSGFHVFAKNELGLTVSVNVLQKSGARFDIKNEGNGGSPNGSTSGWDGSWSLIWSTLSDSNLAYNFGDVTVQGSNFNVADNFPTIGYNNSSTSNSRNLGVAFSRYQSSNDTSTGEIINDNMVFNDTIPNQTSASSTQIKFSNSTSSVDNYYNGWWIKVVSGSNANQVRKIVGYNGAQRVATLDSAWTTQNPISGDTVNFYNAQYVSVYYDYIQRRFEMVYNTLDPNTKDITSYDYVDLKVNNIELTDTTSSVNCYTGSLYTPGGISVSSTEDASSATSGGSFTTSGGMSVRKRLYVGDNIALGSGDFVPSESLDIRQSTATVRLQSANNQVSYIDFVETSTTDRFGILSDTVNNQFCLTVTSSGVTPQSASKFFTALHNGYIGIKTSSGISSPLTLLSSSFISSDTNESYIGIVGGSTNTNDSSNGGRILVYGNDAIGSRGNVILSAGTSGSLKFYTKQDTESMRVDDSGSVFVFSTTVSSSETRGALIVNGGLSISCSEDAMSITAGGALTVSGGVAFAKDLYIGGDLVIDGKVSAGGSVSTPSITFSNNVNCDFVAYNNNKLINVSQEGILSFAVRITPTVSSTNCQIEFSIPDRTDTFTSRHQLIASCTGYTDDDEIVPLFNVICVGVKNQVRGLIKFQSVSTAVHYISVICRYTI